MSTETCILPCAKQMAGARLMHEAEHSKPVLWENPEGWGDGGRRRARNGGTHVHPRLVHVSVWQKPSQYCKVIILQLK